MAHKILLADDSATIRKVVELTFAEEGIEVYSVADGDAAMTKFVEVEPDMLIADVNMPGMNGYRLCEMIKADEMTRHIPVILLVGSFEPFDPGEASRVGSNYYFTKPFRSIRELVEKVTEYLELGGLSGRLEPENADIEDLYNDSFQNTIEMPRPEIEAADYVLEAETRELPSIDEFQFSEQVETPAESAYEEDLVTEPQPDEDLSPAEPVLERVIDDPEDDVYGIFEPQTEVADPSATPAEDLSDLIDHALSEPAAPVFESVDDVAETSADDQVALVSEPELEPAYRSPWEEPVVEDEYVRGVRSDFSKELGDPGMDDEIIETSHPGAELEPDEPMPPVVPAEPSIILPAIDPFEVAVDEPSEDGVSFAPTAADESMADFDWESDTLAEPVQPERSPEVPFQTSPLRMEIDDAEPAAEPAPVKTSTLKEHVTPELIQMIVESVLEKMSDRAVREVAQQAVPEIAEKLIREALDEPKKD